MNAAIYARFSSAEQSATSLDSQVRACKEYALKHGYRIVSVYADEAISGSRESRPEFSRMIADARKRAPFSIVLVWKFSRFFRDRHKSAIYKGLLKQHGVEVVSVTERVDKDSASGVLMEGIIEVIDQFYSARLSEETRRGLKENVLSGFRSGSVAPFGYRRRKVTANGREKTVIIPDPETAPIVQRIFRDYASGRGGFKRLAQMLNEEKIPSARGGVWEPSSVRGILTNEAYIGWGVRRKTQKVMRPNDKPSKINLPRSEWVVNEKAHAAIIDRATWDKAQSRLSGPRSTEKRRSEYLLSGLLKCGRCGGSFTTHVTRKNGKPYPYYICGRRHRSGNTVCTNKLRIPHEPFNANVMKSLLNLSADPDLLSRIAQDANERIEALTESIGPEIRRLKKRLADVRRRLSHCVEAVELGEFAQVRERMKTLEAEKQALESHLSRLEGAERVDRLEATREQVQASYDRISAHLSTPDIAERREAIREHIESITVNEDGETIFRFRDGAFGDVHKGWCAVRGTSLCVRFETLSAGVAMIVKER